MAHARCAGVAAAVLLCLSACSSSKKDDPPQPPSYTLSGTIRAAAAMDVDGDNADAGSPQVQNDTFATAQLLPSAVAVGGWASTAVDPLDWYRATLVSGQAVTLSIADWVSGGPNDLDLCIYTTANPTVPEGCSDGIGPTETIPISTTAEYLVRVDAFSGSSNYFLTLGQATPAVAQAQALPPEAEFVPGEVIVRFKNGVLPSGAADGLAALAAFVGLAAISGGSGREMLMAVGEGEARRRAFSTLGISDAQRDLAAEAVDPLALAKGDTLRVVKALRRRADVASADLNYIHHASIDPNDTHYGKQWHYPLIKLPEAWGVTTGSASVIVAVVDTGVFLAHPDLAANLTAGYDFISDPARARDTDGLDANPDDPGDSVTRGGSSFHGTHVAGTIAAVTNNAAGVAGVSWTTKIMPIRVLGVNGGTSFDIMQGVRYAAGLVNNSGTFPAKKADVINLSLGCSGCFSSAEQAIYDQVRQAGVVIVAAAGNENTSTLGYPASYAGVISVSAVDILRNRAPYSNFGTAVDIAAPGGNTSVDLDGDKFPDGVASTSVDDQTGTRVAAYRFMQGTSMASPHVAGVVALMKALCPTLTPTQVDTILSAGGMTVDIGAPGRDDLYGRGLVDAVKAVQTAQTCGAVLPTTLDVAPGRLDFGLGTAPLGLTATKNGTGTLAVTAVNDDATWLTVTEATVDASKFGTYSVAVDRTGLPAGVHSATITFTTTPSSTVAIPVTVQVGGAAAGPGDAGHLHVLLLDSNLDVVKQLVQDPSAGQYAYAFTGVQPGSYYIVATTDFDGDTTVCDAGEACGAYPTSGVPTAVDVSQDQTGLDFVAGFDVALSGASPLPARAGGFGPEPDARAAEVRK